MPDPFAELLLRLRKDTGRTQEQQADAINTVSGRDTMTRREISRYEKFENVPTNHTLAHIAMACGIPYEELLREAKAARARRRRGNVREEEDQDDVKGRLVFSCRRFPGEPSQMVTVCDPQGRTGSMSRRFL